MSASAEVHLSVFEDSTVGSAIPPISERCTGTIRLVSPRPNDVECADSIGAAGSPQSSLICRHPASHLLRQ